MRRSSRSKSRARVVGAALLAGVMLLAACGGDDDTDSGGGGATTTTAADGDDGELTDSFRGVTADAIKLGVVLIDYECIKDFIDFARGDQQAYYQAVIDDTNANGGVGGRMIEPVYKSYCPVGNVQALEICTAMVDDEEVFAVIGVFIDFSGDAQLCLSREGETVHIGHELARSWIDDAPPGLMLTGDVTPERRTEVLFTLFEEARRWRSSATRTWSRASTS
jgi:hypothetical protein